MWHTFRLGSPAFGLLLLASIESAAAAPLAVAPQIEPFHSDAPVNVERPAPGPIVAVLAEGTFAVLDEREMADSRGGQSVVVANQTMQALTAGNSIFGDMTAGAVNLSDSALSNFNGLGNIMINTGSQVNLQSGMNLTINVNP